jgi:hypothetical protein
VAAAAAINRSVRFFYCITTATNVLKSWLFASISFVAIILRTTTTTTTFWIFIFRVPDRLAC